MRVYQKCDNIILERMDIQVTGIKHSEARKGKIGGIFEIIELNDELTVYQNMVSKYVHDIKNQIMMMLSTSNNIQSSTKDNIIKKYAYSIKDTLYSCNYMLSLMGVDNKMGNSNKLFNMHQVIMSLLDSHKCEVDINFSYDLEAENPRIYANKVLITNVIYNVISSSIPSPLSSISMNSHFDHLYSVSGLFFLLYVRIAMLPLCSSA